MNKNSLYKDLERKDLSIHILRSIISEFHEGENEDNCCIIKEISQKVLEREISPAEGFRLIRTKSIKRTKKF